MELTTQRQEVDLRVACRDEPVEHWGLNAQTQRRSVTFDSDTVVGEHFDQQPVARLFCPVSREIGNQSPGADIGHTIFSLNMVAVQVSMESYGKYIRVGSDESLNFPAIGEAIGVVNIPENLVVKNDSQVTIASGIVQLRAEPLHLRRWDVALRISCAEWLFVSSIRLALRIEDNKSQFLLGIVKLKIIGWHVLVYVGMVPDGSDALFTNRAT